MEAAATGPENSEKIRAGSASSSRATISSARAVGKGGSRSWSTRSWVASSGPTTSGRVESTWPNLM